MGLALSQWPHVILKTVLHYSLLPIVPNIEGKCYHLAGTVVLSQIQGYRERKRAYVRPFVVTCSKRTESTHTSGGRAGIKFGIAPRLFYWIKLYLFYFHFLTHLILNVIGSLE